jgi:hypothetical protein
MLVIMVIFLFLLSIHPSPNILPTVYIDNAPAVNDLLVRELDR